jgi:hypothetical protein
LSHFEQFFHESETSKREVLFQNVLKIMGSPTNFISEFLELYTIFYAFCKLQHFSGLILINENAPNVLLQPLTEQLIGNRQGARRRWVWKEFGLWTSSRMMREKEGVHLRC